MFPRCLKCSHRISLSWLTCAFMSTKHRCEECGCLHEFTFNRRIVGGIVGGGSVFLYVMLDSLISFFITKMLIIGLILFAIICLFPGQFRISKNRQRSES